MKGGAGKERKSERGGRVGKNSKVQTTERD